MDTGLLKSIGLGRVVTDKEPDDPTLRVIPVEHLQGIEGSIEDYISEQGLSEGTAVITASWFDKGGSQRDTAPDMVVGEEVTIYRYGTTNAYYWASTGRDPVLRKTEHIEYSLSNTEKKEDPKTDNQLQLTVSTRDGYLKLVTPSNRGEPTVYTITLNIKEGTLVIEDTLDNLISLDSVERKVHVRTSEVLFECDHLQCTGESDFDKAMRCHDTVTVDGPTTLKSTLQVAKNIVGKANITVKKLFTGWANCPNKKSK